MIDQPLSIPEVQELSQNEGKSLRSDPRKVSHFLARVGATLRRHQEETRQLRAEIERGRSSSATIGQATTLSPLDALRYVSDEEKAKLFGVHAQQQLEYMKRKQAEADTATKRATTLVQGLKYILSGLTPDTESHPALEQIRQLVQTFDAQQPVADAGGAAAWGPSPQQPSPFGQGPSAQRLPDAPQPSAPQPSAPQPSAPQPSAPQNPWAQGSSAPQNPWAQGPSAPGSQPGA